VDPLIPSDDEVYLAKLESLITPDPGASLLDSFARTPTVFNPPMKPGPEKHRKKALGGHRQLHLGKRRFLAQRHCGPFHSVGW
jgi:hypothetical protein